jgi:hypothetical protein
MEQSGIAGVQVHMELSLSVLSQNLTTPELISGNIMLKPGQSMADIQDQVLFIFF